MIQVQLLVALLVCLRMAVADEKVNTEFLDLPEHTPKRAGFDVLRWIRGRYKADPSVGTDVDPTTDLAAIRQVWSRRRAAQAVKKIEVELDNLKILLRSNGLLNEETEPRSQRKKRHFGEEETNDGEVHSLSSPEAAELFEMLQAKSKDKKWNEQIHKIEEQHEFYPLGKDGKKLTDDEADAFMDATHDSEKPAFRKELKTANRMLKDLLGEIRVKEQILNPKYKK